MFKLVSSPDQAVKNILNYRSFVDGSNDRIDSLSKNRAWYAIKDGDTWVYGNSKTIGYVGLMSSQYDPYELDGRQTEAVLRKWFTEVGPNDPNYTELYEGLANFLAEYRKHPSRLARISILREELEKPDDRRLDSICELIVEVAKGLDSERIKAVAKRLESLS